MIRQINRIESLSRFLAEAPIINSVRSNTVIIGGAYGSGKTELAVNMAVALRAERLDVSLADLDIANPYFRSREAEAMLESRGIGLVAPHGDAGKSDLPAVPAKVQTLLNGRSDHFAVIDLGGDTAGSKVLRALSDSVSSEGVHFWQVINSARPETATWQACVDMKEKLEQSAGLKINGFVLNTHLLENTNEIVLQDGIDFAREVSQQTQTPIMFQSVIASEVKKYSESVDFPWPLFTLERFMLPPWLKRVGV